MGSLTDLLQSGAASALLLLPSALLLGVLHGLEPGHSKTMMAAFIIAVRGTVTQAGLLGVAATVSHSAVVWVMALVGLYWGGGLDADRDEPYFELASALLIIVIALSMLWRTWRERQRRRAAAHQHPHHDAHERAHQDAHQLAHVDTIRRRLASSSVTTGRIVMFGLSGGLVPCSAAIAVLVLCLQVKQIWLGIALVLCFSIGLALTLVAAGMIAAAGMRHISHRWSGFGEFAKHAPYLSGVVTIGIGLYVGWQGWMGVPLAL